MGLNKGEKNGIFQTNVGMTLGCDSRVQQLVFLEKEADAFGIARNWHT